MFREANGYVGDLLFRYSRAGGYGTRATLFLSGYELVIYVIGDTLLLFDAG